ncbi:hypothetical protein BHE74_00005243 [Ensete ventricosum]|nr:hypothetical protein BHE74_00005243 [Ensete ventricosum]
MLVLSRFLLSSDSANIKKLRQSYTDFSNPLDKIRYQYTRRHIDLPSDVPSVASGEISSPIDIHEQMDSSHNQGISETFTKMIDRGGRIHPTFDVAEILRRWTHALRRIHKQSLYLVKANNGEGPELLRTSSENDASGHAVFLATTLAEHRQHLVSIQANLTHPIAFTYHFLTFSVLWLWSLSCPREIDHRRSIEEEKGKKKREKKRKRGRKNTSPARRPRPPAVVARGCLPTIAACGSPARGHRPRLLFLPRDETERLPTRGDRLR